MKFIIILSTIMGLFFGLISFIIIAVVDSTALAIPVGILSSFMFGGFLAIYLSFSTYIEKRKYTSYCTSSIKEPILFEDSLFRLNGNTKHSGHVYITSNSLILVIIKGRTILTEIKIPLDSIVSVEKQHDYGHLVNAFIKQIDGTETRFITNYARLCEHLMPLMQQDIFTFSSNQKQILPDEQIKHLQKYISQINKPTKAFEDFLTDYFTGSPMIRGRGEENQTVWIVLEGLELEVAIQMVLDYLGHDAAYIRATGIFHDERAIPMLTNLVETLPKTFCYEKLLAARTLYDWIGFEKYHAVLADVLPNSGEYTKVNLKEWITGIDKETAVNYIFLLLQDESSFVRWCAYGALLDYFNLGEQKYEETKYYTDDKVFLETPLFQERLRSLKERIEAL